MPEQICPSSSQRVLIFIVAYNAKSTLAWVLDRIPAARWGDASDLGGAAVFLASRAADYVHGHVLAVDGGWLGR